MDQPRREPYRATRGSPKRVARYAVRLLVRTRHPARTIAITAVATKEGRWLGSRISVRPMASDAISHGARKPASELVSANVARGSTLRRRFSKSVRWGEFFSVG